MIVKDMHVKDVITKSNLPVCDYSVNPYIGCEHACKYCYACFMKRFTNHAEDWGDFIDVKYWQPIKNPQKYAGKELFIGSVTDPYQPVEEQYRRTRALLEELQGSGALLSIATKSDLILRDLDYRNADKEYQRPSRFRLYIIYNRIADNKHTLSFCYLFQNSTVNLLPSPSVLSTLIFQPDFWHIFLATASPKPKPPFLPLCDLSTVKKRENTLLIFSSAMPIPVSSTVKP